MTRQIFATATVLAVLGISSIGCRSVTQPEGASFASVVIKGRMGAETRAATVAVFQEDGYTPLGVGMTEFVFQKEGSKMNKVAYGNWVGGPAVYVRVKVQLVVVSPGVDRLQCKAYMVRNQGDSFFEEDIKLSNVHRRPYQDLLNQVAKRLK